MSILEHSNNCLNCCFIDPLKLLSGLQGSFNVECVAIVEPWREQGMNDCLKGLWVLERLQPGKAKKSWDIPQRRGLGLTISKFANIGKVLPKSRCFCMLLTWRSEEWSIGSPITSNFPGSQVFHSFITFTISRELIQWTGKQNITPSSRRINLLLSPSPCWRLTEVYTPFSSH